MRIAFSRRESFRTALAALLAPLFSWLRPETAQLEHVDAARPPLTTTYRYDEQGRLLSITTSLDPDDVISWTF